VSRLSRVAAAFSSPSVVAAAAPAGGQRDGIAAVAGAERPGVAVEGLFQALHAVAEILAPRQQVHAQQAVLGQAGAAIEVEGQGVEPPGAGVGIEAVDQDQVVVGAP
jgi:hypothetical protein